MPQIRPLYSSSRSVSRIRLSPRYISTSSSLRYVKVQRPWFRRLITRCLVVGVAIYAWSGFVLVAYDDSQQNTGLPKKTLDNRIRGEPDFDKAKQTAHGTQPVSDSKGLFIPLGWPRLKEGKFYKESDLEWKAFVEISKDKERIKSLKDELASIVLAEASRSDLLSSMLGSPFTITQFWLQPHWPLRAPPAYHRSGVLITDDGMLWASHSMSDKDSDTLHRSIRPFFVALAVKDAYSVFWKRLVNKFNISGSREEQALSLPDQTTKTLLSSDFKTLDNLSETSRSESQLSPPASSQSSSNPINGDSRPHPSIFLSILQRLPLPKPGPGSDLYAASLAFKERLNESWAHELRARHRGTFSICGPVGLRGSLGFCRIEVEGEYDPKSSKWVSVSMRLKDMGVFQQKALGGK
ncbi:hypothetical protein BJX63DRAFT_391336 [Aspergillus granulosus]|uniref:Uncharacterized protein n=1 Tax=Aspergillus granulosus TaxID=176169 RepID=A0ABR4HGX5_9EURO